MSKRRVILITSAAAVVLAAIGLIIGFSLAPAGLSNRKNITINSFFGGETLTLDVKMVKGVYNPDYNLFNADFSVNELCEMRANKSDGEYSYNYEIYGNNAIIYKLKNGERVAFGVLCDISAVNDKQRYLFANGAFRIGETSTSIATPYHLSRDMELWGKVTDKIYLLSEVDFSDVIEFYNKNSDYVISVSDNIIVLQLNQIKVQINYLEAENSILYSLSN